MEGAGELGVEYKSRILVLDLKTFAIYWREELLFDPFTLQ